MIKLRNLVLLLFLLNVAASCVSHSDTLYFRRDEPVRQIDSTILLVENFSPLKIQGNDILAISVKSFEQGLATPYNISTEMGGLPTPFNTFQVDEDGFIDFPGLGKIHLEGKTVNEAKDAIHILLKEYLVGPSIHMRLVNFKVSVLGEVSSPGILSIDSDKITILEAIAMANDLTPYSNATNILIIREQNGTRIFGEINLQSTSFIKSDFYYLRQGDVVYIEPRKDKQAVIRDSASEALTITAIAVQTLASILTIIFLARQ